MEIHVNKCIMHEDNYLIAVSYLHDDQTDGNLLKGSNRRYFDIEIYIWEHLELELKSKLKSELKLELKLSNM